MDRALPPSLLDWPAFLWSRFFAAPSCSETTGPSWRAIAWLIVLPAVLLYPCLSFHLLEPDESRYAQIPAEMVRNGEYIVPTLQGQPYFDKPPLFYWLVAGSYRAFGVSHWAARLVPALALHGTILLTYLLGRRTLSERAAFYGALLLTLSPGFLGMSRVLILDGLLTFIVVLSLFAGFEAIRTQRLRWGWWLLASLACGSAVLTKGPVALILFAPPLWLHRRLTAHPTHPGLRGWGVFIGIVLLIALPWYVALSLRHPSFVSYFFWEHNVQRFLAPGVHVRGVFFYVPILLLCLWPGSMLLPALIRQFLATDDQSSKMRSPELGFHLLAGGWCVLFFTLSSCKLPTYVLPAFPSLALILGCVLVSSQWRTSRLTMATAALSFGLVLVIHHLALPWYAAYRSPMSKPEAMLRLCADREAAIVCYPRNCDSVAFYLGRDDLRVYRSKQIEELRQLVRSRPRTIVLCTHRSSLAGLKQLLPPEVKVTHEERCELSDIPGLPQWLMQPLRRAMGETALGLGDVAVVEAPHLTEKVARSQLVPSK